MTGSKAGAKPTGKGEGEVNRKKNWWDNVARGRSRMKGSRGEQGGMTIGKKATNVRCMDE